MRAGGNVIRADPLLGFSGATRAWRDTFPWQPLRGRTGTLESLHGIDAAHPQRRVWGTTTRSCPTHYSLVSARHLETAFFSVEPAESFTP